MNGQTSQNAELLFLLVNRLAELFLNDFERFLLVIALFDEVALLANENRRRVGDLYDAAVTHVQSSCLGEIFHFRVFLIELREKLHIMLILFFVSITARHTEECAGLELFHDLIALRLRSETSFEPDSHFLINNYDHKN